MTHVMTMLLAAIVPALVQPSKESVEPVRVRLVSEQSGVVPGGTVNVGVVFDIDPAWHLYSTGMNDSGVAPRVTWEVPEGVEVGELQWPAPHRHVSAGDILDHIYEGRLVLIAPVHVGEGFKAGEPIELGASVQSMVCSDVCLLRKGEATTRVEVVGSEHDRRASPGAGLFKEARVRIPKPMPTDGSISLGWDENTLMVVFPGAKRLSFYPDASSAEPVNLIRDGEAKGERLSLKVAGEGRVSGVIEVETPDGGPLIYQIEAPAR